MGTVGTVSAAQDLGPPHQLYLPLVQPADRALTSSFSTTGCFSSSFLIVKGVCTLKRFVFEASNPPFYTSPGAAMANTSK